MICSISFQACSGCRKTKERSVKSQHSRGAYGMTAFPSNVRANSHPTKLKAAASKWNKSYEQISSVIATDSKSLRWKSEKISSPPPPPPRGYHSMFLRYSPAICCWSSSGTKVEAAGCFVWYGIAVTLCYAPFMGNISQQGCFQCSQAICCKSSAAPAAAQLIPNASNRPFHSHSMSLDSHCLLC